MSPPLWSSPSLVEWCEGVTHPHAASSVVAEAANTFSNLVFVVCGAYGLQRALRARRSKSLLFTEAMLIVVGFGSMYFHSKRTYLGELMDELPMSLMALGYHFSLDGLHWTTTGVMRKWTYATAVAVTTCAWVSYLVFHNSGIFTTLFTVQVLVPSQTSFHAARGDGKALDRSLWVASTACILGGKALWEVERWLHRTESCPQSALSPLFWLHPAWHFLAAASHAAWTVYVGELMDAQPQPHAQPAAKGGARRVEKNGVEKRRGGGGGARKKAL